MRLSPKIVAFVLLLINSISAFFGGGNLIDQPDGSNLMLSTDLLRHSPFHDFLVPGIALFVSNGIFGIITLVAMFAGYKKYPVLIVAQGIILMGWLIIQVMMIREVLGLHLFTFAIGISLVFVGRKLMLIENIEKKVTI